MAQLPASNATAPSASIIVDADYQVAPDDVLYVNIVNDNNLTTTAAVTPDGNISLPLIGEIHVSGMTIDDINKLLTSKFSYYVVDPSVATSLTTKHKQTVLVTGFVLRPGEADFQPPMHVLTALADVGGPLTNGSLATVTLTRKAGGQVVLDLSHPETKSGTADDPLVMPGDIIYVPENRSEVTVDGEVTRPGTMVYREGMTVSDALTVAGNILDDADLTDATLTHNGVSSPLNLDALMHHQDMSANVTLGPGDRILIPVEKRTYVYGDVNRPGFYSYKPGDRVMDAIDAAAGPGPNAKLSGINLVRIASDKDSATVQEINLMKFLNKGDAKANVLLLPGDVLYVPSVRRKFSMNDIFSGLSAVSLINSTAYIANHGLGN